MYQQTIEPTNKNLIEDMTKNNNNELEKRNQAFLIYQDENGIARVNVRFEGDDIWLNVEQMMELFDASQQDVSYHINQIYAECEQDPERTHKKFLLVRQEGNRSVRRNMSHYNLDMIIAAGQFDPHVLCHSTEQVALCCAKEHAETEFEKYRIVQDRLFQSDFDRYLCELPL